MLVIKNFKIENFIAFKDTPKVLLKIAEGSKLVRWSCPVCGEKSSTLKKKNEKMKIVHCPSVTARCGGTAYKINF